MNHLAHYCRPQCGPVVRLSTVDFGPILLSCGHGYDLWLAYLPHVVSLNVTHLAPR